MILFISCSLFIFKKLDFFEKNPSIIIFSFLFIICSYIFLLIFFFESNYPAVSLKRPPIYPFFLSISGLFTLDSLYPLIIVQLLLSLSVVIMFFEILNNHTKELQLSFILTLIFILTSIPYILIKFVIAEQLLLFFSICTIYFLEKYNKGNKIIYAFFCLFFSTLAWLTKWEGQLLFLLVSFFIIFKNRFKNFKSLLIIFLVPLSLIVSWVITRSEISKDFSDTTSISNSNYEQFFYKFYNVLPSELHTLKKSLDIDTEENEIYNYIFDNQKQILVINKINGYHSKKLFDSVLFAISNNSESYKPFKKILNEAYQYENRKYDLYKELFQKFDDDYEALTKNIFNQPNIWYFTFINSLLDTEIGKANKDMLFKKSIIEALKKEPKILFVFFSDFFLSFGIDLNRFFQKGEFPFDRINNLTFINPFNAGNCGLNHLTPNQFREYEYSHEKWNINKSTKSIVDVMDNLNDLIRIYFGLIFILSMIFLIIFKDSKFFLVLSFYPLMYDFLVAITVDANVNSKYEVITFTFKYLILSFFVIFICKYLNQRRIGRPGGT
tara:strand:+ start:36 stop:1694 length:1659 start_codon:yes stop_codon:yes gene_type:complete